MNVSNFFHLHPKLSAALALGIGMAVGSSAMAQAKAPGADLLIESAQSALKLVDAGQASALWSQTPSFIKALKPQAAFVEEVDKGRAKLGTVSEREWVDVSRFTYSQASTMPPPGLYANVDFDVKVADGRVARERISFRFEDGQWRPLGYVASELLSNPPAAAPKK